MYLLSILDRENGSLCPGGSEAETAATPGETDGGQEWSYDEESRQGYLERNMRRLSVIEGQVRGIKRMIERDEPNCVAVLMQISSVHEALRGVGKEVLGKYLRTCATQAIQLGSDEVYEELMNVIYRYVK